MGSDLIGCVALETKMQQQALEWPRDTTLAVEGALRRRFFRTGGRTTTRVEVEVHQVTELASPPIPDRRQGSPPDDAASRS